MVFGSGRGAMASVSPPPPDINGGAGTPVLPAPARLMRERKGSSETESQSATAGPAGVFPFACAPKVQPPAEWNFQASTGSEEEGEIKLPTRTGSSGGRTDSIPQPSRNWAAV